MYTEEWKPIMMADSIDEKIEEVAQLAQNRAESSDLKLEEIVHNLTHDSYLLKHTTSDVLKELSELENTYPDAFYDKSANEHTMQYMDEDLNFDFWHDYANLFLAAGLEWAVLKELQAAESS